jgi:hypothetical protein
VRAAALAACLVVGLTSLAASAARADAGNGTGPGGDGSLQLIPEIITNSGISAGGSNEFPVKAELFLPEMSERALALQNSAGRVTDAVGTVSFTPHLNPLFAQSYTDTQRSLFADYAPQRVSTADAYHPAQSNDLWYALMVAAALPLIALALFLGTKNASRRMKRHGRPAH